jgi:hypothetical protein
MGQEGKKEPARRMRRRNIGMAGTAGVSDPPTRGSFTRTLALLRAALRAWEARNEHLLTRPVWQRRDQAEENRGRTSEIGGRKTEKQAR